MKSKTRPENQAPPEIFYNDDEARKYTSSSRIRKIQVELAHRAVELLALPTTLSTPRALLLDLGCGSGLSGEVLSELGHMWIGVDISEDMLRVARENEVAGDVVLGDLGDGLPVRAGIADGAISISALQWLCNADVKDAKPHKRLQRLFESTYAALRGGARAVFQLYPANAEQLTLISSIALKSGFTGGVVIDYPNSTKAKKYYLCLTAGESYQLPPARLAPDDFDTRMEPTTTAMSMNNNNTIAVEAIDEGVSGYVVGSSSSSSLSSSSAAAAAVAVASTSAIPNASAAQFLESRESYQRRQHQLQQLRKRQQKPTRLDYVLAKKDRRRRLGLEVRPDSKYTGRKRRPKF